MAKASRKRKSNLPRHTTPKKKNKAGKDDELSFRREAASLLLLVFGVFLMAALWSHYSLAAEMLAPSNNIMGVIGAALSGILTHYLGYCAFAIVLWAVLLSRSVWVDGSLRAGKSFFSTIITVLGSLVMVSAASAFVSVLFGYDGGGKVGASVAFTLISYISSAGTLLVTAALFVLSLSLSTGFGTARLLKAVRRFLHVCGQMLADAWFVVREFCEWSLDRIGATFSAFVSGSSVIAKAYVDRSGERRNERAARMEARIEKRESQKKAKEEKKESKKKAEEKKAEEKAEIRVLRPSVEVAKKKASKKKVAKEKKPPRRPAGADKKKYPEFVLPPSELLVKGEALGVGAPDDGTLIENSRRLEQTLQDFKISGKIIEVQPGPVITLYQFLPAAGIKVQKVISLADDIALSLRVASVRIYAPVPGKGTVGIEVPNEQREIVRLREVVESDEFQRAESPLTLCLGKDTFGASYVANLARMPHLLIAGATGTGKSVCINSLLLSLLYRNTPDQLQLILIDPKMLELSVYEDIPHLKAPVVTNPKRARGVLWWAVEEMERRYQLMKEVGVRNLSSYNRLAEKPARGFGKNKNQVVQLEERDVVATGLNDQPLERGEKEANLEDVAAGGKEKPEALPHIVIVVDELADLMLTVGREVEELFTRLAQKARAAGIHLVLATQRPSVNVITGLIKANFPARLSFKVASRIDSRTVLDESGSERLLGDGDMLFTSPATRGIKRLHGAFVSDNEVADVVATLRAQRPPAYDSSIEQMIDKMEESEKGGSGSIADEEYDPLYDQAVGLVVEKGQASTSMVQRAFRIGYNRAARILDVMEQEGVVGPADGSRPRQVLVPNRDAV